MKAGSPTLPLVQCDPSSSFAQYNGQCFTDKDMNTRSEHQNLSRGNSGTSHIKSKFQCDELLVEWPVNRDRTAHYPSTIISEYGPNVSSKNNGMVTSNSLPDMLDLKDMELLPCPREQSYCRHPVSSTYLHMGMWKPSSSYHCPAKSIPNCCP